MVIPQKKFVRIEHKQLIKRSYITEMIEKLNRQQKISLNMDLFYHDFIFDDDEVTILDEKITKFARVNHLKRMKNSSNLGSLKAPLPLKFLKFLIDYKKNKEIYNIVNILGTKLYMINDLDPKGSIILVELKESFNIKTSWQLVLHRVTNTK